MAKTKTTFFCQNCGAQFPKWVGKCNSCNEWNTIVEEVIQKEETKSWKSPSSGRKVTRAVKLGEITGANAQSINTTNTMVLQNVDDIAELPIRIETYTDCIVRELQD